MMKTRFEHIAGGVDVELVAGQPPFDGETYRHRWDLKWKDSSGLSHECSLFDYELTPERVAEAIRLYEQGMEFGKLFGRAEIQRNILRELGVNR